MNRKTMVEVAVVILLALAPSRIAAQSNSQPNQKTQTVTGCLTRGEAVTAYRLVTPDGIWNISGAAKLKIDRQVGHTVTVNAKVAETFDTKTAKKPSKDISEPDVRGILNVTKITMVSASCTN